MASTSTQIVSSSSSSSTPPRRYDVFLSFYGEDTRKSFTNHLYAALIQKGIIVFKDDEKLKRGKYISKELIKAIQESMYAIVVISPNYASSRWCLIELAKIVECMRHTGLTILPIFYHIDPSHVRKQKGTFAEAFGRYEKEKDPKIDMDEMQMWRDALTKVGNISGWHVHDSHESKVVEDISRMIFGGMVNFSNVSKGLVGIESRAEEIMSKLCIGLDDVRFLGIHGMGGIGKTTLSKFIYERVSHQFEASCYIANIREETITHGLLYLQKQLIYEILMEREINIWNDYGASRVIMSRLQSKKVFIVLDDVDGEEQLNALAGSHDWFGQGSRIIITSRDHHLLNRVVNDTYKVKNMNKNEALQLFSRKAFKKSHPEENYVELSREVVNYAQGLPLALEVFGSFLFGRDIDEWENIAFFFNGAHMDSVIHKLKGLGYYPNININVLVDKSLITISKFGTLEMHDLLRKMGQKIVHDESAEPGKRSRLCHDKDVIHVLKNDTGTDAVKGIVLKLPLKKPERINVEAFSKMKKLKMLQIGSHYYLYKDGDNLRTNLEWHGDASNFMLSNELCIMKWLGYPFESLPTNFQSDNLFELIMRYSCIKQVWVGRNSFDKLKHIDLRESQNLIKTPDLSGVPNLEKLDLECCTSLSIVHPSIQFLRRLKLLNLQGCKSLKRLPDEICLKTLETVNLSGCSRLNKIPDSVGNMTSLRYLYLEGTAIKKLPLSFKKLLSLVTLNISNCSRLVKIPENLLSGMECRRRLYVGRSATRKLPIGSGPDPIISHLLPNSFSSLSCLRLLDLSYRNLSDGAIPSDLSCLFSLSNLDTLDLSYCNLLDGAIPSDLSYCLSSLDDLNLSGNKFTRIPDSVAQLSNLSYLDLKDCSWLQVLPKLPLGLTNLSVRNCPSLELFYKQMEMWSSNEKLPGIDGSVVQAYIDDQGKPFKILRLHPRSCLWSEESLEYLYPEVACGPALVGSGIPEWFNVKSTNSFGTIQLHSDLGSDMDWEGYALFIVYEFHEPHSTHARKLEVDERKGNSNSTTFDGSNSNFPIFVCHFQVDGVDVTKPLVLRAPEVPSVGPNGFWVYIPKNKSSWAIFGELTERFVEASITTGSLNVEVKEYGARLLRDDEHDASELYQSQRFGTVVACGPALLGYGIPKWFNSKSTNSFGTIQMHIDVDRDYDSYEWKGYALFIVYQFHEPHTYPRKRRKLKVNEHGNSNSTIFDDSDPNFSHFVCQFQANEVDVTESLVLCAPEVSSVGPSGFWVYIPAKWFGKERNNLVGRGYLKASITAGNLKVEVKKCGARVVRQHDASEFYQVLNSISPHVLDFQSLIRCLYGPWWLFGVLIVNIAEKKYSVVFQHSLVSLRAHSSVA
ncbi:TMV resistance protein N-like [Corylus avellana]|uniref:TMV resistance protein N-like n=1 Tax=Corylus avellana TaxID=13451 RepID=UPI00286D1D81|nr:TMV resistance protein N-like [Corylus avellana]